MRRNRRWKEWLHLNNSVKPVLVNQYDKLSEIVTDISHSFQRRGGRTDDIPSCRLAIEGFCRWSAPESDSLDSIMFQSNRYIIIIMTSWTGNQNGLLLCETYVIFLPGTPDTKRNVRSVGPALFFLKFSSYLKCSVRTLVLLQRTSTLRQVLYKQNTSSSHQVSSLQTWAILFPGTNFACRLRDLQYCSSRMNK